MIDFTSWLQKTLDEVNRKNLMGFSAPSQEAVVRRPQRGDMLITSPGTFLSRSSGRKVYRNKLVKPWMITSDQDPTNGTITAVRTGTGANKQFNVDDILYDVTDAYPNAEDRLGAHHVWLYIPPNDLHRKHAYERWHQKQMERKAAESAPKPDKDTETQARIAQMFGVDQDFQDAMLRKHRRDNFNQQKMLGNAQIDQGDDPRYINQVAQLPPLEKPNPLADKIALLRAQSDAAKNGPQALRNYQNQHLRRAESYRYF